MEDDFLFYGVDVDMYQEGYGVLETVACDLIRTKSLEEATKFAKKYAKDKSHFDFGYLRKKDCDCYLMTIRKYYKEPTEDENGEWDDWDTIKVVTPRIK